MSHALSILTFPASMDKSKIAASCDEWGRANGDPYEGCCGLPCPVQFTNKTFEDYDEAEKYLDSTFGNYSEIAVKFEKRPEPKRTKAMETLETRIREARDALNNLQKPHYASVSQATVKCKNCGSSLATKYCGKTYRNSCPVCGKDLRPTSALERIRKKEELLAGLQERLSQERKKERMKSKAKPKLFWAVACEVHC